MRTALAQASMTLWSAKLWRAKHRKKSSARNLVVRFRAEPLPSGRVYRGLIKEILCKYRIGYLKSGAVPENKQQRQRTVKGRQSAVIIYKILSGGIKFYPSTMLPASGTTVRHCLSVRAVPAPAKSYIIYLARYIL